MSEALEREARIEALVEAYLDALQAGEQPDRAALLGAHPDIAEALDRRLSLVEAMHRLAQSQTDDGDSPPAQDGRAIRVRCPHCGNPIQLIEPRQVEVTCRNCGTSFPVEPDATASRAPDLLPPAVGKFQILGVLGRGTFGTVYKATDPDLTRTVAIKVPRAGYFPSNEDEERFLREARSAARLHHPGIVKVLEIGRERGLPYIVSDFIEGPTLADMLTASRPGFRESADLVARIADALAYAHLSGIIHRDIKPSNILLDPAGRPLITDFGLARRDEAESVVTLDGQILGTPAYMSPEQASGDQRKVGPCSDVYSLGVVLYVLLTGELPFRGNSRMLIHQVLHDDPKPPRSLDDKVPRDLETICLKAMAKESAKRYDSAEELTADLRRFLDGAPIRARRTGPVERTWRWCRRNSVVAGLIAAVVSALLAGVAFSAMFAIRARQQADEARRYLYAARINLAQEAWDDGEIGRMEKFLDLTQPGPGEPDTRGWEWQYLWRLCHDDLASLEPHVGSVTAVAFSPDGRLIASGGESSVELWDSVTRQELMALQGHTGTVFDVAFSPDGQRLVSAAEDQTVRIWDLARRQSSMVLRGHSAGVRSVAFSPDGRLIASGGADRIVRIWAAESGLAVRTLNGHSGRVDAVRFGPDGRVIASAETGDIRIWDVESGDLLKRLYERWTDNSASGLAFSPDGRQIAAGYLDKVIVWDIADGRQVQTLQDESLWTVSSLAFSPDGRQLLSGSWDEAIRLWDVSTGKLSHTLKGHTEEVNDVAFSPDGRRIVSAGGDETIKIWDAASGQQLRQLDREGDNDAFVNSCAISPDGRRLALTRGNVVAIVDAESGHDLLILRGHTNRVNSVAFGPDGLMVASGGSDDSVKIWDSVGGALLNTLTAHGANVTSVGFSPDGRSIASGSSDWSVSPTPPGMIIFWDVATGREVRRLLGHAGGINCVAFRPDGRQIASASKDGTVKVWDVASGREIRTLGQKSKFSVDAMAYSPDGRWLATASTDRAVRCWDAASGHLLRTFVGRLSSASGKGLVFSPDGRRLVSGDGQKSTIVYDASNGQELVDLIRADVMAFSPDGQRLVLAGDRNTVVLDARPLSEEVRVEREARGLVEFLAARPMLSSEIPREILKDTTISGLVRKKALNLAGKQRDDPWCLNKDSWSIVAWPSRMENVYRLALVAMENVCLREPKNAEYLTTLGAARYRLGQYPTALATLTKAEYPTESHPALLAFLAMTQHRLGQSAAKVTLDRLRAASKDPEGSWRSDDSSQALVLEAENLIDNPELPADVFAH